MPVTFQLDPVEPRNTFHTDFGIKQGEQKYDGSTFLRGIRDVDNLEFITSSWSPNNRTPPFVGETTATVVPLKAGLLDTAVNAYNYHYPLVLRPDDIWLTLLLALSLYVNAHAERMRHHFVRHAGQEKLRVFREGSRHTIEWDGVIDEFGAQIKENINDPAVYDWLTPNFTTTTAVDGLAAQISIMSVMSKYFRYEVHIMCGLPEITLAGEREDWIELQERAKRLTTFNETELTRWHGLLVPILGGFVNAFDDEIDVEGHWAHMIKNTGGSGMPLDGWIAYLFPFDDSGRWMFPGEPKVGETWRKDSSLWKGWTDDSETQVWYPELFGDFQVAWGTLTVPVYIYENGGEEVNATLLAGVVGQKWDLVEQSLSPYVGWALYVADEPTKPEEEDYDLGK